MGEAIGEGWAAIDDCHDAVGFSGRGRVMAPMAEPFQTPTTFLTLL